MITLVIGAILLIAFDIAITIRMRNNEERYKSSLQGVGFTSVDDMPDYVAAEAERVADIVRMKQTPGSLTFTAMSDFHVEYNTENEWGVKDNEASLKDAGLGLTELKKRVNLDLAVNLGDYSWVGGNSKAKQVKSDIALVKYYLQPGMQGIPNIWCTGNHDINYGAGDRRLTEQELFAYLTSNNRGTVQDSDNIGRNYGYVDFENQKIRCIYLNTVDVLDHPNGTEGDAQEITPSQTDWLIRTALNLSDKEEPQSWGIVLFSHHCLSLFPHVTKVLTAYKDGASGSAQMWIDGAEATMSYDFTSGQNGEIICAVHGHNHNFIAKKISDETWTAITPDKAWLWSICVPNIDTNRNNEAATSEDANWAKAFGEFDTLGDSVYYEKTQGTATSTSFSVFTIDRKTRKIHITAYGAGYDRELDY